MDRVPAICGGAPLFPAGPPTWPRLDPAVLQALEHAYADGSWGRYHGPHCERLIALLAEATLAPHVRLCSSGTIAVELALRGLGVEAGDEVILGAYDFPGNFRAIEAIGAVPVLVDLDEATFGIDVAAVAHARSAKTKAVIASHLHGSSADMPRLRSVADELQIGIVEDACQASGALVDGKPAGCWGDVGAFSFGGSKLLTAGRGGAIVSSRADVMQRVTVFSERGNDAFPLSELQAAVLVPQIESLPQLTERRFANASLLRARLCDDPWLRVGPWRDPSCRPAFYKLGMRFACDESGGPTRDDFAAAARAEGIALDAGFRGFAIRGSRRCRRIGELPVAAESARKTLLLHHPILLESDDAVEMLASGLRNLSSAFRYLRINSEHRRSP